MDSFKFVGISGGARSWSKWMGWAAAGCSLLAAIAACSSDANDPASSDVVGVGGASPRNELAASVDQARAANGGRIEGALVAQGGQPTPNAQANPNLKANAEPLQGADSAIQAPKVGIATKVLDLPAGGSFAIPLAITSSSASSYYDWRTPVDASYDGNKTTFWMTAGNSTHEGKDSSPWIQYTFDRVYPLGSMRLVNFNTYEIWRAAKDVDVLVSQDGVTFTSIGYKQFTIDPMTGPGGTWQGADLGGQKAKAVKLAIHSNYYGGLFYESAPQEPQEPWANASVVGLNEVQFFSPVPIVSSSASSYLDWRTPITASYDGNESTPWMTTGNSAGGGKDYTPWIQYDFDRVYALDSMRVLNFTNPEYWHGVKDVEVLVSQNGTTFTSLGYRLFAPSSATAIWQSLPLGGQPAKSVKFVIHTNYFNTIFWSSPAIEGPFPNATIPGLSEVQFYATVGSDVACAPNCTGKTCGSDGCGGSCGGQLCTGSGCVVNADCAGDLVCSGVAPGATAASICQPLNRPSTCTNGVRDVTESDIDCGGMCGACTKGQTCKVDSDCGSTRVCGQNNGAHFGLARSARVCWDPSCETSVQAGGCGQEGSACGKNCVGVTSCVVGDPTNPCAASEVCGAGLGAMFGSPSTDVCVNPACPSNDPALCGDSRKLCGPTCQSYSTIPIVSSSASSFYDWRFPPSSSYDGDPTTLWMTAGNSVNEGKDYTPWVQYTFDRAYRLQGMRLTNFPGYEYHRTAKDIEVLVSQDGATFTSAGYKVFPLGSPVTSWLPSPATPWQSVDLADLGGQPVKSVKLAIHTNYYGGLFYGTPPQPPQEPWANASVVGFPEVRFYTSDSTCSTDCSGKVCGRNGCGQTCGSLCTDIGCVLTSDCAAGLVCSGYAAGGSVPSICQPPGYGSACANGVRDWNETDVDCGGPCAKCGTGKICTGDADCTGSCGLSNGAHFGLARNLRVCWEPTCNLDVRVGGCGEASSPCGTNCSGVVECDAKSTSNPCKPGESCAPGLGSMFGASTPDVCVDTRCPSNDPALCGGPTKLCGACVCKPNCSAATCANPGDGCNGICPGVCQNGETGCHDDLECGPGFTCLTNPSGPGTCRPDSCAFKVLAPPLCGHPGAACGDQCPACSASCDGRQCGPDPRCGQNGPSCGTCSGDTTCNAAGQCVTPKLTRALKVPDGNNGTKTLDPLPESPTVPVGALAGQFNVSDQGTPVYTVPIEVPPGRAGMEPALSLQYSGTRTNGEVGLGWHIEGLSKITRCPGIYALDGKTGPVKNDKSDKFCIDGKRLESLSGAYGEHGTEYRTLIDTFSKVISYIDTVAGIQIGTHGEIVPVPFEQQGPDYFIAWTKDGRKLTYGRTYDSTVLAHTGIRYAWLLSRVEDRAGNTMDVKYANLAIGIPNSQAAAPNSVVLPSAISYTGHTGGFESAGNREVHFDYEDRTDPQLRFTQGGSPFVAAQRLSRITTFVDQKPVKNYRLQYVTGNLSQVEKIFECAAGDDSHCKAPTTFTYSHTGGFAYDNVGRDLGAAGQFDMNGDGLPDFMATNVIVGGVPAQPTLKAAAVVSDVAVSGAAVAVSAFVGPEAGFAVSLTWDIIKAPFFGLFAKKPTITFQHELNIATGKGGYQTFSRIPDVHGLRCSGDHPAFMLDFDQDGRDDVVSVCSNNGLFSPVTQTGTALYVARSVGDGTFESYPADNSPVAYVVIGSDESYQNLPGPILIDLDGDGLQDIVSCPEPYSIDVQRRLPPPGGFAPTIRWSTPVPTVSDDAPLPPRELQTLCGSAYSTYNSLDVDGDGTPELLAAGANGWSALRLSTGGGTPSLSWQKVELPNTGGSDTGKNLNVGDFNGDGLADIFGYDSSRYTVWLNTGAGRFFSRSIARPAPTLPTSPAKFGLTRVAVLDYDTDGRDDFLEHWETPTYDAGGGVFPKDRFNWALKPSGQVDFFDTDTVPSIRWLGAGNRYYPGDFTMAADVNGDGHTDLLGSNQGVFYGSGDVSLSRITDGLGKVVEIQYGGGYQTNPACAQNHAPGSTWPDKCLPRMSNLVGGHIEGTLNASGNFVPERTYSYTYINGRMNLTGHGWLGFDRRIISASSVAAGDAGSTTTIDYSPLARYTPSGQLATDLRQPYLYPFAGLPRIITVDQHVNSSASSFPPLQNGFYERRTQTVNHWTVQQSSFYRPFPVVDTRTTSTYERPIPGGIFAGPPLDFGFNGYELSSCTEVLESDGYGNLGTNNRRCTIQGVADAHNLQTTKTYVPDPVTWLISNPETITVNDLWAERKYRLTYSNGLLATVTRAPDDTGDLWHRSTYVRDDWGNVKQVVEEANCDDGSCTSPRSTNITYEDDAIFPNTVTDSANDTTQVTFDPVWGTPSGVVDSNGVAVQFAHDGFGRLTERHGPDGVTVSTYSGIATPNRVTAVGAVDPKFQVTQHVLPGADGSHGATTVTEYDAYGRPVRTVSDGFGGAKVYEERVYDEIGRVHGVTKPHIADPQTPIPNDRYSYDDSLRRLTRVDHSDGSFKQIQYATRVSLLEDHRAWLNGLVCWAENPYSCEIDITRTIDEEFKEDVVLTDIEGSPTRNIDGNNIADAAHTSDYLYGPFEKLGEIRDNLRNVTKLYYDDYGRKLTHTDPDSGATVYTYNGFDELRTSKDPKQQLRTYTHDSIGRLKSILDDSGTTQWVYQRGRLVDSISPSSDESPSGQRVHYDYEPATASRNRGLLQSVTYTIDGTAYSVNFEHDDLGRTSLVHYPSLGTGLPIVAQYKYDDSMGMLTGLNEVGSGTSRALWRLTDVYQGHLIKEETLGSGSSVTHTSYGYDADRYWPNQIRTTLGASQNPEEIQSLIYTQKRNGLVGSLDAKGTDPRTYSYDSLNRLSEEIITPPQGQVSKLYHYDEIGNLVDNGPSENVNWPGKPHLVHYAGGNTYYQDANGNVSSRIGLGVPGGEQLIDYTPFDLPKTIRTPNSNELFDSVRFDYSADEERVLRRDADGVTRHFVSNLYQRKLSTSGTTLEEHFRLYLGDRQIAEITRKDNADQTLFFHPDHLGSPETVSDSNGAAYHERFDPFGKTLETPNPELTRVGFTGQDHDNDLGLIDMKGRIYDPLVGRFLTPDPIMQAPFWSQGLNRYSYVFNNPINNTDPSGFEANGGDSTAIFMGWGAGVTGLAALSGYGGPAISAGGLGAAGGIAAGIGSGLLNPITSLATGFYNIGDARAASTQQGAAPTAAPKGGGTRGAPGAMGQLEPPAVVTKAQWMRAHGVADDRLAMGPGCLLNPMACAQVAVDAVAAVVGPATTAVEAAAVTTAEVAGEGALRTAGYVLFFLQLVQMPDDINHSAVQMSENDERGGRGRLKSGEDAQDQVESIEEHRGRLKPGHRAEEGEKTKEAIRNTDKSAQRLKNKLDRYDERDWGGDEEE